ncbi:MurR/RpiR family transcriptional regulator [Evansella clarkii]|uniref:MurR/RpiR family transcriptional regulator n=1 Tax=Evansella clarkii TaxID=79879 RepID=UPI001431B942|nr:MurR/RpiR family transcriptional regulator [Evansella clarkii]
MLTKLELGEAIRQKYESLSEGQRQVAKYLLEQPEESAFKTASQIGKEVGVSESTVIRLAHSLDYEGFTQIQQAVREQVFKTNSTVYKFQSSADTLVEQTNIFSSVLLKDIEIFNKMLGSLREKDLWEVVDSIIEADQVVVAGQRISQGPAYWFSFMLNLMLGKVNMYPASKDMVENMLYLTEESVVVLISFPRYSKESIQYARLAREKGAKIIAVTDNLLSPSARIADKTLTTEINTSSGMDAIASITSLLNLIIAGISSKNKSEVKERLKMLEKEYKRQQIFEDY